MKKAVPVPVIATVSEAWQEAIRTVFRFLLPHFCQLRAQRRKFYLNCHVAPLLAMTASKFFSSPPERFPIGLAFQRCMCQGVSATGVSGPLPSAKLVMLSTTNCPILLRV